MRTQGDKCSVASKIPTSVDMMGVVGVLEEVRMCADCGNTHRMGVVCVSISAHV